MYNSKMSNGLIHSRVETTHNRSVLKDASGHIEQTEPDREISITISLMGPESVYQTFLSKVMELEKIGAFMCANQEYSFEEAQAQINAKVS